MRSSIEEKLDQLKACVHCGMCLSACPTYLTTGNEGHSPRGRLYLIRDFVEQTVTASHHPASNEAISSPVIARSVSNEAIHYLDACLSCQACETACPSGVEYASILDYARHKAKLTKHNQGFWAFIRKLAFKYLLPNRKLLNILRSAQRSVIARNEVTKQSPCNTKQSKPQPRHCEPAGRSNPLRKISLLLNLIPKTKNNYKQILTNYTYTSKNPNHKTVSLPLGCVMDTLYNHVHWDTIKVLNHLGYDVYIPDTDCCGALASHSGEYDIGAKQTEETLNILSRNQYPVVFNSAGCGAHLKHHCKPRHCEERSDEAIPNPVIARSVSDEATPHILDFIELIHQDLTKLKLKNTQPLTATYHPACHLNHAQGIRTEYQELLKLIPNLTLIPLLEADVCCGSAGFYNLIKPEEAAEIGARKAQNIELSKAGILITANPGCISQIQAHLGNNIEVVHPISLIAKYLDD